MTSATAPEPVLPDVALGRAGEPGDWRTGGAEPGPPIAPDRLAAIGRDVQTIAAEVGRWSPNRVAVLSALDTWDRADRSAHGTASGAATPHLDELLTSLSSTPLPSGTRGTVDTALDATWRLLTEAGDGMRHQFLAMVRRSARFAGHVPGHGPRGFLDWEGRRADALLPLLRAGRAAEVARVLDDTALTDRDDVVLALMRQVAFRELEQLAASTNGRDLIARLYDELTAGSPDDDEQYEAARLLLALTPHFLAAVEAGLRDGRRPPVFVVRSTGLTVGVLGLGDTASHLTARPRPGGRVWVQQDMHARVHPTYARDLARLPLQTFTARGLELGALDLVGVRFQDRGRVVEYGPALWLVSISNEGQTLILTKLIETAGLALSLVGGSAAVGVLGLSARTVRILDAVATTVAIVGTVVSEHRAWFVEVVGEEFVAAVELASSLSVVYGLGRVTTFAPAVLRQFRRAYGHALVTVANAGESLDASAGRMLARVQAEADKLLARLDDLVEVQPQLVAVGAGGSGLPVRPDQLTPTMKQLVKRGREAAERPESTWTAHQQRRAVAEWRGFVAREFWVDMRKAPEGSRRTSPGDGTRGWPRNSAWFWRRFHDKHADKLSARNREFTRRGLAPEVDDEWVKLFPEHRMFEGDVLVHHHVERGPWAVPIPARFHHIFHGPLH
jgi:hypothetical protein